jgi:choline dehydrogenase
VWDYVIVGAGSAGCVLAYRLGQDPDVRIAVVEAGPADTEPAIDIPLACGQLFKSQYDWDFVSEPEPGLGGRRNYLPRGRGLGGSSLINAMIYIRGNHRDYDEWEAMGFAGWGSRHMLSYFKRAEDNEWGASEYHGAGGPLTVSDSRSMHPLVDACIAAAVDAGVSANADVNGALQDGAGRFQATQRNGRRCSTAAAYLWPAVARGNVDVLTDALVTRIVFDGDRASGVELTRFNETRVVSAAREVILAAGAYNSPQILMLSGIGPAADLGALGIDVREDLPVGRNLQDHIVAPHSWITTVPSLMDAVTPEATLLFEKEGRGPLSSHVGEGGAFVRTDSGMDVPDIQFHFAPVMLHQEALGAPTDHAFTFGPLLLRPQSTGQVSLRGPLAHQKPRIMHNYLMNEQDRRSMIDGCRIAADIASQGPLREIIVRPLLGPASLSDDDILAYVQQVGHTVYHPVGTCSMGTVVDSDLRVHGVRGLRVADASILPTVPRGNTNAPVIAMAEKAADIIAGLEPLPATPACDAAVGAGPR